MIYCTTMAMKRSLLWIIVNTRRSTSLGAMISEALIVIVFTDLTKCICKVSKINLNYIYILFLISSINDHDNMFLCSGQIYFKFNINNIIHRLILGFILSSSSTEYKIIDLLFTTNCAWKEWIPRLIMCTCNVCLCQKKVSRL